MSVAHFDDDGNINNSFIKEHAPLVKRIAHHLLGRLPSTIQVDDLVQAGMIGLLEAAKKFDSSKGASFSTYAGIRIRGAMLDEVRRGDWVPRSVHRNSRMVSDAIKSIENSTGRDAKDTEVAHKLGVSLDEFHQMVQDSNTTRIFAFEELGLNEEVFTNNNTTLGMPLENLQSDDFKNNLAEEISKLPEREKLVLALYYDEELNLREVGDVLGVSESRVSQIHSQAMVRLQSRMSTWRETKL